MDNLEMIKKKLEDNNKVIEMLTIKKQQEDQIRLLYEKRIEEKNKEETDPKYITRVVAAQELITYMLKYRMYGLGMLLPAFILIFAAKFNYYFTIILAIVAVIFGMVQFMHINKAIQYLTEKYKLPGYERYSQPNFMQKLKPAPTQQQKQPKTKKQLKKEAKAKQKMTQDREDHAAQVRENINRFFSS